MMKTNVALMLLLFLSACVTNDHNEQPLPDGKNVPLGRSAYVDGPVIRPIRVLTDSRCPINARCIWPGTLKIEAVWIRAGDNRTIELELGKPVPLADGSIELISVKPQRIAGAGHEIRPEDYRFGFRFMGGL